MQTSHNPPPSPPPGPVVPPDLTRPVLEPVSLSAPFLVSLSACPPVRRLSAASHSSCLRSLVNWHIVRPLLVTFSYKPSFPLRVFPTLDLPFSPVFLCPLTRASSRRQPSTSPSPRRLRRQNTTNWHVPRSALSSTFARVSNQLGSLGSRPALDYEIDFGYFIFFQIFGFILDEARCHPTPSSSRRAPRLIISRTRCQGLVESPTTQQRLVSPIKVAIVASAPSISLS